MSLRYDEKSNQSNERYLEIFKQLVEEYRSEGGTLDEKEEIQILSTSFSIKYAAARTKMACIPDDERTVERLKMYIIEEHEYIRRELMSINRNCHSSNVRLQTNYNNNTNRNNNNSYHINQRFNPSNRMFNNNHTPQHNFVNNPNQNGNNNNNFSNNNSKPGVAMFAAHRKPFNMYQRNPVNNYRSSSSVFRRPPGVVRY